MGGADSAGEAGSRPLIVIKGDATPQEVAALVAVLQAAAAGASATPPPGHLSAWSDPGRAVRRTLPHGPGAWRASALPR